MNLLSTLGTKVARRVVTLFVLCALVPVAAAIALSYGSVRDALVSHRTDMLRGAAANFATALVDRLAVAESVAQSAAERIFADGGSVRRYFSAAVTYAQGTARVAFGDPVRVPNARLGPGDEARIDAGETALVVLPADAPATGVWLMRAAGERRLAFEVSREFLWSVEDALPVLTDVCVYSRDGAILHCTRPLPRAVPAEFHTRAAGAQSALLGWDDRGTPMLSARRELFLRGKFGADPWEIFVSQPETHALSAAEGVTRAVVPVIVLSLLVAALLGLIQVRRTMRPLQDLADVASRVGTGDFKASFPEERDDEFGALARSFNAMSARLGRQFSALSAHAEIDAVILSSADVAQVVAVVLRRVAALVRADRHLLLLADRAAPGHFRVHSSVAGDWLDDHEVVIPAAETARLLAAPEGLRLSGDSHAALVALAGLRTRHAFALPIASGDGLAGVLMLAYLEDRVPGADDIAVLRDLGDRIAVALGIAQRDRELERRAHYDALTQLPNRLLGMKELERAVAAAARQKRALAVLFVDLDDFSAVNDSLGHAAGDQLLVQSAARLRASVRESDIVTRLSGDEFAVALTEVRAGADAAVAARNVIAALSGSSELGAGNAFISASVGIALFPADGGSAETLLQHADMAMYRAKQQGRGQFAFFEASMNAEVQRRIELEGELRLALERGEFELHYQPQLDLRGARLIGGEALIRWRHPSKGMVPPLQFIGHAETNGLIEPIGRWALETACAQFVSWREQGVPIDHVSVNVSPRQFRNPDFVRTVSEALARAGMPAASLRLEITESAVIDDHGAARANLAALVALGTPLELDDFGTGYSSLAHLQNLPVAAIKLDRAFTRDMESKASALAVVQAAIDMAHALGKTVVAEGVETAGQLALLQRLGCDTIQGYHVSRPVPADEFAQSLRSRAQTASVGRVGIEPTTKGL
jgi:diguanylate cyclase (GGDEF)-like protein